MSTGTGELLVVTVDASLESANKKKKGGPLVPIRAYATRALRVENVDLGWQWVELLDGVEFIPHSVSSWEQLAIRAYTPLTSGHQQKESDDDDASVVKSVAMSENVLVELQNNMGKLLRLIDSLQKQYVDVQAQASAAAADNGAEVDVEHARIGKALSAILQQVGPLLIFRLKKTNLAGGHTCQL